MIRFGGKIPLTIHPAFWIFAALIGFLNSGSFLGTCIWIGIILISVLFHEFGHALTALLMGKNPRIELVAMGGITYHGGEKLPFWKQFIIVLNGPLFGFLLFLGALALRQYPPLNIGLTGAVLLTFQWVNLIWTMLNLLPVLPLDGGQLLRILLESFFGLKGFRYALFVSMMTAFSISLAAFLFQYFLIGAILFMFAFQSFDTWKKSRFLSEPDRDDKIAKILERGEGALQRGEKEAAKAAFEELRSLAKGGMTYNLATQYLAFIYYDQGNSEETYKLLLPIRNDLNSDALCLLHRAAFTQQDYSLVETLAAGCFQVMPNAETALRNAFAAAQLNKTDAALGWLQAALDEGLQNLREVLTDRQFDPIRSNPSFQKFQSNQ
jgi:Zn-dependent protease